ncbi:MAG: ATP-grasp domain-containing protein [Planctomycetales bacterium]
MSSSEPSLLILGASTRAAAWSALRAGFQPICSDLFLDTDLQAVARVLPVATYPAGFEESVRSLPPTPWIYTGGLENHPRVIAAISAQHPLLGISSRQVQAVRDPWLLREAMASGAMASGIVEIPKLRASEDPPQEGNWLVKPWASSGGRGISVWNRSAALPEEPHYFQEFVPGRSVSALYLGTEQGTLLLGTAEQLGPQENISPFAYCGSAVPATIPDEILPAMKQVGEKMTTTFSLRGLFGCDFILAANHSLYLLEVNPRYTASVELHEHALCIPLLKWHVEGTAGSVSTRTWEALQSQVQDRPPSGTRWGKRILYATQDFTFPGLPDGFDPVPVGVWDLPRMADIPAPGARIRSGEPICSVFACGETEEELAGNLQAAERAVGLRKL